MKTSILLSLCAALLTTAMIACTSSTPTVAPTEISPAPTAPSLGDTWTRPADGATMVYVPAGEFQMGSTDEEVEDALVLCNEVDGGCERSWFDDEQPVHMVALDGYWIDRTEVTVAQFRAFTDATGHETTAEREGWGWAWVESAGEWQEVSGAGWQHPYGPGSSAQDDHPVVQVSWEDAVAYCTWAGVRLPTEAEWEVAARGPEGYVYPWGGDFEGRQLNYCDVECPMSWKDGTCNDGYALTAPVGSYPEGMSWVGALDLAGNVWEWVADWYGGYLSGQQENPTGSAFGRYRVLRGGSWDGVPGGARSASRSSGTPDSRGGSIGFRCAGLPGE